MAQLQPKPSCSTRGADQLGIDSMLRIPRRSFVWAQVVYGIAVLWALTACESKPVKTKSPTQFDHEHIASLLAVTYCDVFVRCKPDIKPHYINHPSACLGLMKQNLIESLLPLDVPIENGLVEYDARHMDNCLLAIANSTCIAFEAQDFEGKCDPVFAGYLPADSICTVDEACADGFCEGEQGCGGTCKPLIGEGESCNPEEQSQCIPGLDCAPNRICIPKC